MGLLGIVATLTLSLLILIGVLVGGLTVIWLARKVYVLSEDRDRLLSDAEIYKKALQRPALAVMTEDQVIALAGYIKEINGPKPFVN